MCPESLPCGIGPKPSPVRHFLPARGETFSRKLPFPQGGEDFTSSFPTEGKGDAWCSATPCQGQSLPGVLPHALFLDPFKEMAQVEGTLPWQSF
jgi:hypothetical protein